jgi:hypothetical protein
VVLTKRQSLLPVQLALLLILLLGPAVAAAAERDVPVPDWVPSDQHAQYIETYLQDETDFGTGRTRSSVGMARYSPSAENPLPPPELADWFMLTAIDPRDRAAVRDLVREGKPSPLLVPGPDGLLRFAEGVEAP